METNTQVENTVAIYGHKKNGEIFCESRTDHCDPMLRRTKRRFELVGMR